MAHLQDAQARLDKALTRLEKAATAPSDGGDIEALKTELATARARGDTLEGRGREVSDRLDSAIGRIKSLLEG